MHRFIPDADGAPTGIDPAHTRAIREWARDLLGLAEETVVTVRETRCADAGCPVVETVVAVFLPERTRVWSFHRPAAAVTRTHVAQALAGQPRAGNPPG